MTDSEVISETMTKRKQAAEPLDIEVITSGHEFESIAAEWNELVEQSDVHIFQTWEWQHSWWKIFGGNNNLHILLFRDGDRLAGIMPMFVDSFRLFGVPLYRCLRMLGSRVIQPQDGSVPVELAFSDYLSPIVLPGYEPRVEAALRHYLTANPDLCDDVVLEEVPEENFLRSLLLPGIEKNGWNYREKEASTCPRIEFPESWDDLLGDLSSNARYQIRRDIRRVTDDKLFEYQTCVTASEVKQAFEKLVEFHQRRWHNLGRPGIFADKRILEFFREVTMRFHEKGWLLMKSLKAEGRFVAIDLLFQFKGTIYMIQRAFDDSSEYNQYGPGNVLLYTVIKEAIDEGFEAYDFLRGEESYKLRTANRTPCNREILIRKKQDGIRPGLNEALRGYAHLKRKIQNEKKVAGLHWSGETPSASMGTYLGNIFKRGIRKLNLSK